MKNWIFCLSMAFFAVNGAAQDTTFTRISTEPGTLEQQQIETEADRLFGVKVPARWMVNVHASPYSNFSFLGNSSTSSLALGAEFKLNTAFSVGVSYAYEEQPLSLLDRNLKFHHITFEQRWYPKMERQENNGSAANNFTGAYWGLRSGLYLANERSGLSRQRFFHSEIRYGIQRRLRKYGLFDYSAGVVLVHTSSLAGISSLPTTTLQLNQQLRIGLAVFEKQDKTDYSGSYCGILHCFDEQQRMFKLNTLDLIRVFYQKSPVQGFGFTFKPNVAFEQKIGSSPFSAEVETGIDLYFSEGRNALFVDRGYTFNGAAGLRWYYNQSRRIAAGRSGNNLSGPFVAVRAGYAAGTGWASLGTGTEQKYSTNTQVLHTLWGYQLRIFKHGYAAFRIGPGAFNQNIDVVPDNQGWKFDLFSDLKVGFAF